MKLDRHLFDWPSRHNVHLALPLLLVLSFLLHAACVLVFQASYPRNRPSPQRPAQVFFLRPGSPEAVRVEPLMAAGDPALFSPGQIFGRDAWKLPETTYVASFDAEQADLSPLPSSDSVPPPSSIISSAPVTSGSIRRETAARITPGPPTEVVLGGTLAGWKIIPPSESGFIAPPHQGLTPAEFLVAVSPDGLPMHIFPILERSSGNEALDQAALRYLARARFSSEDPGNEPAWGTATFLWGTDVKRHIKP